MCVFVSTLLWGADWPRRSQKKRGLRRPRRATLPLGARRRQNPADDAHHRPEVTTTTARAPPTPPGRPCRPASTARRCAIQCRRTPSTARARARRRPRSGATSSLPPPLWPSPAKQTLACLALRMPRRSASSRPGTPCTRAASATAWPGGRAPAGARRWRRPPRQRRRRRPTRRARSPFACGVWWRQGPLPGRAQG